MKLNQVVDQIERNLHSKWKAMPATEKQKRLLNELGVSFSQKASKGEAFLLISKRLNRPKTVESE